MRWVGPIFVLSSLLLLIYGIYWQANQSETLLPEASNIRVLSLQQEQPVSGDAAAMQAEKKLINIFASWCTPCIAELPYLETLRQQSGLPLVGIAYHDSKAKLEPWLAKHGNPFDVIYLDPTGKLLGNIGISGLPETLLVDGANRVLYRHRGVITAETIPEYLQQIQ